MYALEDCIWHNSPGTANPSAWASVATSRSGAGVTELLVDGALFTFGDERVVADGDRHGELALTAAY